MIPLRSRLAFFAAVGGLLAGCTLIHSPPGEVTLSVTNATCEAASCTPLAVHAFVPKFTVPGQPPWGFLDIGTAGFAATCLTLPGSHTITPTGREGSTEITWTPADPIRLTAVDPDSAIPGVSSEFVPANESGWAVTFGESDAVILGASSACAR